MASDKLRLKIITAMLELAADHPILSVSLGDIASRAGVTLNDLRTRYGSRVAILEDFAALIDEKVRIFDSHAIMLYLAEKNQRFIPTAAADRATMLSWLMLIATGLSPFSGQAAHFLHYAPEVIPYARNRYVKEVARHYAVLNQHLAHSRYLIGNEYSIADMALWGWGISAGYIFGEKGLKDYPHVLRLVDEISNRPAAIRTKALRDKLEVKTEVDEVAIRSLFPQNY